MKRMYFFIFLSGIISTAWAQDTVLFQKIHNHNHRMDSIHKQMANYLEEEIRHLHMSAEKNREILEKTIEEYENLWDYNLMREMERFRTDLGLDTLAKKDESWRVLIRGVVIKKKSTKRDSIKRDLPRKKRKKKQHVSFVSRLNFGWNNFNVQDTAWEYDYWRSRYFGFDFLFNFPLNKKGSMEFFTGAGLLWSYLSPANQHLIHSVDNGKLSLKEFHYPLEKSKLRTFWWRVPAGFRFHLDDHWEIGMEAYAKFYGSSMQRLKYHDGIQKIVVKEREYFRQNRFIWGLGGYIGYNNVHITFGMDFVPYFKDYDKPVMSIGLSL